eukprot:7645229-Lingulodinium_polyedra.AAC.1
MRQARLGAYLAHTEPDSAFSHQHAYFGQEPPARTAAPEQEGQPTSSSDFWGSLAMQFYPRADPFAAWTTAGESRPADAYTPPDGVG